MFPTGFIETVYVTVGLTVATRLFDALTVIVRHNLLDAAAIDYVRTLDITLVHIHLVSLFVRQIHTRTHQHVEPVLEFRLVDGNGILHIDAAGI